MHLVGRHCVVLFLFRKEPSAASNLSVRVRAAGTPRRPRRRRPRQSRRQRTLSETLQLEGQVGLAQVTAGHTRSFRAQPRNRGAGPEQGEAWGSHHRPP